MGRGRQISNRGYFFTIFETVLHRKYVAPLPGNAHYSPTSLSLSLSHSSFKALEFLVPDSQSKYAFLRPTFACTDASCNPWPKITLENDTQSKRGRRLTFICDTIRNVTLLSRPPPRSFKRVFSRSSRWIQILARLNVVVG